MPMIMCAILAAQLVSWLSILLSLWTQMSRDGPGCRDISTYHTEPPSILCRLIPWECFGRPLCNGEGLLAKGSGLAQPSANAPRVSCSTRSVTTGV